jgi:hypothetical protein
MIGMRKRRNSRYRRDVLLPPEGLGDGDGEELVVVPVTLKTPAPVSSCWNFKLEVRAAQERDKVRPEQLDDVSVGMLQTSLGVLRLEEQ